jgi:hypothetical protein
VFLPLFLLEVSMYVCMYVCVSKWNLHIIYICYVVMTHLVLFIVAGSSAGDQ